MDKPTNIARLRELYESAMEINAFPPLDKYIEITANLPALLDELEKLREFKKEVMAVIEHTAYTGNPKNREKQFEFLEKWSKADG